MTDKLGDSRVENYYSNNHSVELSTMSYRTVVKVSDFTIKEVSLEARGWSTAECIKLFELLCKRLDSDRKLEVEKDEP